MSVFKMSCNKATKLLLLCAKIEFFLLMTRDNNESAWLYCCYHLLFPTSVLKLGSETVYAEPWVFF